MVCIVWPLQGTRSCSSRFITWNKLYPRQGFEFKRCLAGETAFSNRFLTYYQMQRYQDALADVNRLIQFDPTDASAHHDKGVTLSILARKQDALLAYTEAIRLAPQNGGYSISIAKLNKDLGNRKQAYEDAIRAQQLGYNVDPGFIQSVQ